MNSSEFSETKRALVSGGFTESKRLFLDCFDRDYIRNHDCPECGRWELEPTIFRRKKECRLFGRCPDCGHICDFS